MLHGVCGVMTQESETVSAQGEYHAVLRDEEGNIKEEQRCTNLIVDDGLSAIAGAAIDGVSQPEFGHIAVGTDDTAPSSSQSGLVSEDKRSSGTGSLTTKNISGDTAELVATFSFSSSKTIEELGVFDSASGGTMLSRSNGISQPVSDGDNLNITFELTIS